MARKPLSKLKTKRDGSWIGIELQFTNGTSVVLAGVWRVSDPTYGKVYVSDTFVGRTKLLGEVKREIDRLIREDYFGQAIRKDYLS